MKFLRNPAWLAVIVGVLAIAVSVVLYLKAQPVKNLRVEILSNSPLISIDTAMASYSRIIDY
jgi:hypothetical protein